MARKGTEAPKWTAPMRAFVVSKLATFMSYKDIHTLVTDPNFKAEAGIIPLDGDIHTYDIFRGRCYRLSKKEIAKAREEFRLETGAIKWATEKERIAGLSGLIDKLTKIIDDGSYDKATTGTMATLVGSMRSLYEQIRKEISADADRAALSASGTRVLLANPANVQIDADYIGELMLVYRQEVGGLHKLNLSALTTKELTLLKETCNTTLNDRKTVIDTECEIMEDEE